VVAGGSLDLVSSVEPGASAVPVHAGAQLREVHRDVVRRCPGPLVAVLAGHAGGELVVAPGGTELRPELLPVIRGGAHESQPDLLDQGILVGRAQRRRWCRRLGHVHILSSGRPIGSGTGGKDWFTIAGPF